MELDLLGLLVPVDAGPEVVLADDESDPEVVLADDESDPPDDESDPPAFAPDFECGFLPPRPSGLTRESVR